MGILDIRPAVRGGSKVIINICGTSGSGKTKTALKIARGFVNSPKEIGFLDTENKRGSLYADEFDEPFMIGDLYAPFSPKRYIESIKDFQDEKVKVLVIDSISHEYEGDGGCEDIANLALLNGKKMADWNKAKYEHKKFMNALLQCNMHLIICVRAREKTDFKDPNKPVSLGIQPICEKNFMFEATASIMMYDEGKKQEFIKMPSFFKPIFGDGNGYLGESHGRKIMDWVNTGEKESDSLISFRSKMRMECENGIDALKNSWIEGVKALNADDRKKANSEFKIFESSAIEYGNQKNQEMGISDIIDLYELKKDKLSPEEISLINNIVDSEDKPSYQKVLDLLNSK